MAIDGLQERQNRKISYRQLIIVNRDPLRVPPSERSRMHVSPFSRAPEQNWTL